MHCQHITNRRLAAFKTKITENPIPPTQELELRTLKVGVRTIASHVQKPKVHHKSLSASFDDRNFCGTDEKIRSAVLAQ